MLSPFSALQLRWKQLPAIHKILVTSAFLLFAIVICVQPTPEVARDGWNHLTQSAGANGMGSGPLAGGIPLRVMFIGASMTLGEHSTGEVGYRKQIRDWLVSRGNPVNYVGQVCVLGCCEAQSRTLCHANISCTSRIDTVTLKTMMFKHLVPNQSNLPSSV